MLRFALLLTAVACAGCKKPEASVVATGAAAGPDAGPARPQWTPQKIEAFLEMNRTLLALYVPADLPDGGAGPKPRHTEGEVAATEEAALKKSGLSQAEVTKLNALLAAMFVKRAVQSLVESDSMLQQLREAQSALPDGSVPDVDAAAAAIVDRQRQQKVLAAERARFGDGLVDLVLARESDLMGSWYHLMMVSTEGEEQ